MAENVIADEGPWQVDVWDRDGKKNRVVLQSYQFKHDVALEINGDFGSPKERIDYANALCKQLNEGVKALKEKGWTAS